MTKKFISVVLSIGLGLTNTVLPVMGADVGNPGQIINGDYVVVVNTNANPENKQSTGTLVFDNSHEVAITSIEDEINQEPIHTDDMVDGSNIKVNANHFLSKILGLKTTYKVGDRRQFYQGKTYICIGVYDKSYIWMEESMKTEYDAANKTNDIAEDMRSTYESKPYDVLMELSNHNFPYNDGSGKLSILLEKTSNGSSGFYAGEQGITAIHINIPKASDYTKGKLASTNGLLVHEGQHAIFRNLTCGGDATLANRYRWFDEGLAVAAMDYTWGGADPSGWLDFIQENLQIRNGSPLVYTSYRNSSAQDYAMPDLFVRYLANQMSKGYNPMSFFQTVYSVKAQGKDMVTFMNDLFKKAGLVDANQNPLTFDKALEQFYTAIIAQDKEGVYGFYGDPIVSNKLKNYPIYMGESGKSVELAGTAAIVLKTENGQFKIPTDGGKDIRYIAVNKSNTASKPEKGSGTASDPYKIETVSDLLTLGIQQGAYFVLTKDLDLTGSHYISAGWFGGILDGQGHTIKGLAQPLIERNSGKISNLNIEANFNGDYSAYTGAIADINEGTIANCSVTGQFNVQLTGTGYGVIQTFGGLVGRNEVSGTIRESFVDADINLKFGLNHGSAAALVGKNSGTIENSYTRGSLKVQQLDTGNYKVYVGGITGELNKDMGLGAVLENCYSITDIKVITNSDASMQAIGRLYGYGQNLLSTNVSQCYALDGMPAVGKTTAGINTTSYSKTDGELKKASTYLGWAFGGIWKIIENQDYPIFTTSSDIGKISVSLSQNEQVRYVGEELSLHSAKLNVNGTQIPLTNDMVGGFDSRTPGIKTITGSYKDNPFSFNVTVKEPQTVSDLVISKTGKTSYIQGDSYSSSGVVLMATLDGNQYRYIKNGFTSNLDGVLLENQNQVTFTYYGEKVSQAITVNKDEPKSVKIMRPMTKLDYYTQEQLDFSGIGLQVTYASGKTSNILTYDDFSINGIRLIWEQNGIFTPINPSIPLSKDKNGATIYACLNDVNPGSFGAIFTQIATITVEQSLHLENQVFFLGQNIERYDLMTEEVVGGTGSYTFELVEGQLPKGIKESKRLYSKRIFFDGAPTEIGETKVVYKITDSVGNTILTELLFVVQAPSNKAEVESFSITSANSTYPGVVNGTHIEMVVPAHIDLHSYWSSLVLSEGSTYYQPQFPPVVREGTQSFSIVAQDNKTIQNYTLTIKKATVAMQQLTNPQNLVWDYQTTLAWDPVPHAKGYIIEITPENDVSYIVNASDNRLDLSSIGQKSGNMTLSVFAVGDNVETYTSEASNIQISYTSPPKINYMRMTPEEIEVTIDQQIPFNILISADKQADKTVTWSVEGATSRQTSINSNGVLTIGKNETASKLDIVATSNQDSTKFVKATVLISNPAIKEDFNVDGIVDEQDLELISKLYNVKSTDPQWDAIFDLNADQIIDLCDIVQVSNKINCK